MDSDPGEGTTDGRIRRTPKRKNNSKNSEPEIKREIVIKKELTDTAELIKYSRKPSTNPTNAALSSESESDGSLLSEDDIDYLKKEVKCEDESDNVKKASCSDGNEQPNGIEDGNENEGNRNIPTTKVKKNGKVGRSVVKDNGRNRILTKKRNMANATKKQRSDRKKMHKCQQCNYSTSDKSHLTQHIRTHTGEKPFECSVCCKKYASKTDLNWHSRVHSKELPFDCLKCGRRFANRNEKQSHEERCKGHQFECYVCCKFKSFSSGDLKRHMRSIHTGDKPFRCAVCKKQFVREDHSNRHLKTHAKPHPINCSKCLRRFAEEDIKWMHEKSCNRRHYECNLCKRKFQKSRWLKSHIQKHHI